MILADMQEFSSHGVRIAYLDAPPAEVEKGRPVLLIHGFASNHAVNWVFPQWLKTLNGAGRRVIAFDNRGHGRSEKLYRPEDYELSLMVADARNLLDHLGVQTADVMGYSLGARIATAFALAYPERAKAFVFGGLGGKLLETPGLGDVIARALEAPSLADVEEGLGKTFRTFAEATKSDLQALAACARGARRQFTEADLAAVAAPVLVAVGSKDDVAGDPQALASHLPSGEALVIPDRDHNRSVGDATFKRAALDFLERCA
ncbi:MAG: alpha/beta fold hydrolase [Methylovirgula sp.]|uniref:alpha/beta fold hydrolase n=1 Tax=Methylovirgula sp. TaxID=1978224 RepID=UPI0030767FDA